MELIPGDEFHLFRPAVNPRQQFGGGDVQVAPAADHAVLPTGGLGGGIFQDVLLVAIAHGLHFGVAAPFGDHVQHGLEAHHQVGGLQGLPAPQG